MYWLGSQANTQRPVLPPGGSHKLQHLGAGLGRCSADNKGWKPLGGNVSGEGTAPSPGLPAWGHLELETPKGQDRPIFQEKERI